MFRFYCLFVMLLFASVGAIASVMPLSQPYMLLLSDGNEIEVTPAGTRDNHWLETSDGRKILQRGGFWFYAERQSNGELEITAESLVPGVEHPAPEVAAHVHSHRSYSVAGDNHFVQPERMAYRYPGEGQYFRQNLLVVRVAFSDQGFRYSDAEIEKRIFASQNSVNHYFLENSYGNFDIKPASESSGKINDGIVSVVLPAKHPDFGSGYGISSQNLAREALSRLPQDLNLASYDKNSDRWLDPNELAIVFLVAGYEQAYAGAGTSRPRIWTHKSSLYQGKAQGVNIGEYAMFGERHQEHQATIGIICHELGHLLFDLPDLYDRHGKSMGVGRWGLMGLGGWNTSAGDAGSRPAHMLGWSKEQAGFLALGRVKSGMNHLKLRSVTDSPDVLEVNLDGYRHGQRILLEHRRQHNFDIGLPGEGVLVTRVDDWVGYGPMGGQNDDVSHQLVDVEEADGGSDLDQNRNRGDADDVFRSASGKTLFSAVSPSPAANKQQNAVELLDMEAGIVANISLHVTNPVYGDNLGHDEIGPNASWGKYHGVAQALVEIPLTDNVVWIDGLDWFALGAGRVDIEIYRADPQQSAQAEDLLWKEAGFPVVKGWNRLMLDSRLANKNFDKVYLLLTSRAEDDHLPLVTDVQGQVSGKTRVRTSSDDEFKAANFDIAARLLVMNRDIPAAPFFNRDSGVSRSQGGGSSGGGAFWLLLLLVLVPRQRRV